MRWSNSNWSTPPRMDSASWPVASPACTSWCTYSGTARPDARSEVLKLSPRRTERSISANLPVSAGWWLDLASDDNAVTSPTPDSSRVVNSCNTSRSEEHTSELQSLMRTSYAVFCLKKKHTTLIHL